MASAVARVYSGCLGAMPLVGSRGKAPGQTLGAKPPKAESNVKIKLEILRSRFDYLTFLEFSDIWLVMRIYWSHVLGLDHSCLEGCYMWHWGLIPHAPLVLVTDCKSVTHVCAMVDLRLLSRRSTSSSPTERYRVILL